MDLMSRTDLFDRLEQRGTFSEPEAAGMVYNLLVAVRFIAGVPRRTVGGVSGEGARSGGRQYIAKHTTND